MKVSHQKIRAILKKEGFTVGHNYNSGRISGLGLFSGGLEVTKSSFDDYAVVMYCQQTSSLHKWNEEDEKQEIDILIKVKECLITNGYFVEEVYNPFREEKRLQKLIVKGDLK